VKKGYGRTDIGKVRAKNEDAIYIADKPVGALDNLYIVADGMGGHKAGEIASGMAIEAFCDYILQKNDLSDIALDDFLKNGVLHANARVYDAQADNASWRGMGTTFSVCTVKDDRLYYAHVGDSRIYTIAGETLTHVSNDHSLVGELFRLGKITKEEASAHPNKNIVTRSLGTDSNLEVDTGDTPLPQGTGVLICSDGLSDIVSDSDILEIMIKDISDDVKADALVEAALKNGGKDNITLIIIN